MSHTYFNSIKVRLKLSSISALNNYTSLFQFHKGTIKTMSLPIKMVLVLNFNSIKVRLKPATFQPLSFPSPDFNSIKVRLKPAVIKTIMSISVFQFHKGTIKT